MLGGLMADLVTDVYTLMLLFAQAEESLLYDVIPLYFVTISLKCSVFRP